MPSILAQYFYRLNLIIEAEESFYGFVKQAFSHFDPATFVDGWHIEAICEHLEACYRGETQNLIVNIPPRCMKTAIISVMFPAWVWIHDPGAQFLCIMASELILHKASNDFETLISSKFYQERWGHKVKLSQSQNTKDHRKNTKNGSRMASTILGKIVGKGGQYIIIDDPNNSRESDTERTNINSIYDHSIANRVNDPSMARRIVTQQRTHHMDLSGHLLKKGGWVHLMLPMEYEFDRRCSTIKLPSTGDKVWSDKRIKTGDLLWPEQFSRETLKELYQQLESPYIIAGQYQQRPSPEEGGVIKKIWFKAWKERAIPRIDHIIQSWDTAFNRDDDKESTKTAYSVATTWGIFKDKTGLECILLLNVWREKVEFPDLLAHAARLGKDYRDDGTRKVSKQNAYLYKPDTILVESQATGGPLMQELRRVGIIATPFYPQKIGGKIKRVQLVSHLIENGRVYLLANEKGDFGQKETDFIEECSSFPNGAYKDQVDTLTQVLHYLRKGGWLKHSEDEETETIDTRRKIYPV